VRLANLVSNEKSNNSTTLNIKKQNYRQHTTSKHSTIISASSINIGSDYTSNNDNLTNVTEWCTNANNGDEELMEIEKENNEECVMPKKKNCEFHLPTTSQMIDSFNITNPKISFLQPESISKKYDKLFLNGQESDESFAIKSDKCSQSFNILKDSNHDKQAINKNTNLNSKREFELEAVNSQTLPYELTQNKSLNQIETQPNEISRDHFSIFVDPTQSSRLGLSLNKQTSNTPHIAKEEPCRQLIVNKKKNYNDEGSLFYYEQINEKDTENGPIASTIPAAPYVRKPLSVLMTKSPGVVEGDLIDKLIASRASANSLTNDDMISISETTCANKTNTIEFEPPAACSTVNIMPLLNKFNENRLPLATIIDDSFEVHNENDEHRMQQEPSKHKTLETSKFSASEIKIHKDKDELVVEPVAKVKILEEIIEEKTLSKILADDMITTQWSASLIKSNLNQANTCNTVAELQKKVIIEEQNETRKVKSQELNTNSQFKSCNESRINIECDTVRTNILINTPTWDYNFMEIHSSLKENMSLQKSLSDKQLSLHEPKLSQTVEIDAHIKLKTTNAELTSSQPTNTDNKKKQEEASENYELLTSEKLEESFSADYYKIYFNNTTHFDNSDISINKSIRSSQRSHIVTNVSTLNIPMPRISEQIEPVSTDEVSNTSAITTTKIGIEMTEVNLTAPFKPKLIGAIENMSNVSIMVETKNGEDKDNQSSEDQTLISRSSSTINTSTLNDTVVNAVREPFNFEVKNRLLNRKANEYLAAKSNFVSLRVQAPVIQEKKTLLTLADRLEYRVIEEIGKGAFAKIYLIERNEGERKISYALKADIQSTAWEYYITETLHDRLEKMRNEGLMNLNVSESFVKICQFVKYNNGCLSVMNYYKNGSLLDLINYHVKRNECFPYWFVLYLTLELLSIIEHLHKCQIIHADIKPDNLLINMLPDDLKYFDQSRTKCLVLIDFNRSIDLHLLPDEAEFEAKITNKSLMCCEMKLNKAWNYHIDYFGMLSSIHCIIFKKYMQTYSSADGLNKISQSMPRNYDKLFDNLFETFLNIPSTKRSDMPNMRQDWIEKFVGLFKKELASSFFKSSKYLKELNSVAVALPNFQ
jgi:hypothetical protein